MAMEKADGLSISLGRQMEKAVLFTCTLFAYKYTHSPWFLAIHKQHDSKFREPQLSAKMVKAIKSHELETDVSAAELWKIYGTRRFVEVVHQLLPQLLQKVVIVRGDGGIGTVVELALLPPGSPSPVTYKEEFTKIDNENYIKEVTAIEGDVLKPGFAKYVTRLQIIDKGPGSSVIKSSVEYEIDDGHPELEAAVTTTPFALAARAIAKYVKENK